MAWNGYLAGLAEQRAVNNQASLAQLQQAQGAQSLLDKVEQRGRESKFREGLASLGPDATNDDVVKLAVKSGVVPAKDIATILQGAENKKLQVQASKEMALSRLQQASQQADAMLQFRMSQAKTQQERDYYQRQHQQYQDTIARERLYYETGTRVPPPSNAPYQAPAPQAAPNDAAALSPTERQAFDLVQSGQAISARNTPTGAEIVRPAPVASPVATPAPAPAPQPAPVLPVAPVPNEDAQDRRIASEQRMAQMQPQAVPVPTGAVLTQPQQAPAQPPQPVMPTFTGSPKEVAAAKNRWLMEQAKRSGGSGGDFSKTGDEFLASLPDSDRTFVKKLAAYEIDPKTLSTRGGAREQYLKMASQYDPTFDQKNYNTISQAITRFATGKQGDTVRSLNVAIEHLDTAKRLATELKNGNIPAFNALANTYARETGGVAPTNFEAVRDIVANEVVKGTIGGSGALEDRKEAANKIRASSSPAQFIGVMNSMTELMGGQLKGLERQYEGATGRKDFSQKYLTPRTLDAISSSSPVAKTVRAMGWEYEPDKYEYRVSNGQVQRRLK